MRGVRSHRLFGRNPLPAVQVGFEKHSSHERDRSSEARAATQPALNVSRPACRAQS